MKRMFTFLLSVMMLTSLGMKAQFSADVHDVQRFNWREGIDVDFKLSEVAAQLQCTPGQLVDALDERAAKATDVNDYHVEDGFFMLETSTVAYSFYSEAAVVVFEENEEDGVEGKDDHHAQKHFASFCQFTFFHTPSK